MTLRIPQANFSKGELAPQLYGRSDVDAWQAGLRKARNVIVLKYGGVTRRPGTRLVGEVLDASQPNRLIPFQFSMTQTYALEMGQGYMAPCAMGGRLLEDEQAVTAITNAANARLSIAWHGFATGDRIYLSGVAGGMGLVLNDRIWIVTAVIDAGTVAINADTTGCPPFTGCTGGTEHTAAPIVVPPPTITPPVPTAVPPTITYGGGLGGNRLEV